MKLKARRPVTQAVIGQGPKGHIGEGGRRGWGVGQYPVVRRVTRTSPVTEH